VKDAVFWLKSTGIKDAVFWLKWPVWTQIYFIYPLVPARLPSLTSTTTILLPPSLPLCLLVNCNRKCFDSRNIFVHFTLFWRDTALPTVHNRFIAVALTLLAKLPRNESCIRSESLYEVEEEKYFGSFLLDAVRAFLVVLVTRRRKFRSLSVQIFLLGVWSLSRVFTVSRCVLCKFLSVSV
jgi:hypothetical protein